MFLNNPAIYYQLALMEIKYRCIIVLFKQNNYIIDNLYLLIKKHQKKPSFKNITCIVVENK